MSDTTVDGQVAVQSPFNPLLGEYYTHPDFRVIAAFSLGSVFLGSMYHLVGCVLLRDGVRRLCAIFKRKKQRARTEDIEAPSTEKALYDTGYGEAALSRHDVNDSAFIFILNLCFAFASVAQFASLLDLGSPGGNSAACAFVVAWSSMAAQSARVTALVMLSLRLRRDGVKHWEMCIFWAGLLSVLGLVFAVNATGPGTTSVVGAQGVTICYRELYLPLSVTLSSTLMVLEMYTAGRFASLRLTTPVRWAQLWHSLYQIDVSRALALLALDICTVVPAAIWVNTLAQNIPFSVGSLLVIAAFNSSGCTHPATSANANYDDHNRNWDGPMADIQRLSHDSMLTPSPFLLHFMDTPMMPDAHGATRSRRNGRQTDMVSGFDHDLVLHITRDSLGIEPEKGDDPNTPPLPRSAPAQLADQAWDKPRKILPSQVEYIRGLEEERAAIAAIPTGPMMRRPRERPQVFVVVHDEDPQPSAPSRNLRSTIIGSDIIRLTPRTPRKNGHESNIWSPESSAPSSYPYSPRDSAATSRSPYYNSLSTPLGTPSEIHWRESVTVPKEPTRSLSWRLLSRQSYASTRTQNREELPTVAEGPSEDDADHSQSTFGRAKGRRQTFGQSWKIGRRESRRSRKISPITVPSPALFRRVSSPEEPVPPLPTPPLPLPLPLPPVSPLQVRSPHGVGRGAGILGGTGVIKGPRPPPLASLRSPAISSNWVITREQDEMSPRTEGSHGTGLASDGHV